MGRQNVALVCTYWTDLPDRAFRVLVYIANLCKDNNPEARYYGGRDPLCEVLGAEPSEVSYRRVQRALADCVAAGALVVAKHGGNGRRAEYALTLESRVGCQQESSNSGDQGVSSDTLRVSADAGWVSAVTGCMSPSDTPKATAPTKPTTRDNSSSVSTSPAQVLAHDAMECGGWAGEDDEGRPRRCPICKPHLKVV